MGLRANYERGYDSGSHEDQSSVTPSILESTSYFERLQASIERPRAEFRRLNNLAEYALSQGDLERRHLELEDIPLEKLPDRMRKKGKDFYEGFIQNADGETPEPMKKKINAISEQLAHSRLSSIDQDAIGAFMEPIVALQESKELRPWQRVLKTIFRTSSPETQPKSTSGINLNESAVSKVEDIFSKLPGRK